MDMHSLRVSLTGLALLALAPLAAAQERTKPPTPDGQPPVEVKVPPVDVTPEHGDEADPHAEMERLMGEVERKMRRVNRLLEEASSGRPKGAGAKEELGATIRAIDELLKKTEESSRSAVSDIDKILELAEHPHSGGT
ncbi:MAG: hypothetical protein IPJ77_03345 [Planctomycetes bacterium]|nr:hypothetical protein [Planctomycetota bacterium]